MPRPKTFVVVLVALFAQTLYAQVATLPVENDTKSAARIWLWPKSEGRYTRPSFLAPAEKTRSLTYKPTEKYWIVAIDAQRRQAPIGWYTLSDEVLKNPDVKIVLSEVFEERVRTKKVFNRRTGRYEMIEETYSTSQFRAYLSAPIESSSDPEIPEAPIAPTYFDPSPNTTRPSN